MHNQIDAAWSELVFLNQILMEKRAYPNEYFFIPVVIFTSTIVYSVIFNQYTTWLT